MIFPAAVILQKSVLATPPLPTSGKKSKKLKGDTSEEKKEPRRSIKNFFRTKTASPNPGKDVIVGSAESPLVTPEKIINATRGMICIH